MGKWGKDILRRIESEKGKKVLEVEGKRLEKDEGKR